MDLKGLTLYVYRHPLGDFSNGGISGRCEQVTLVGQEESLLPRHCQVFTACDEAPAVSLMRRRMGGSIIWHVQPWEPVPTGQTPYMFGGTYVMSSDSRVSELIGFYGAIAFHDRTETWEHYEALTR